MTNIYPLLSELFPKEEILNLYNKEFKHLSHKFTLDYVQSEPFKEKLKQQIQSHLYSFFTEYKSKYKPFNNHFIFRENHVSNETLFLNALVDDYVDSISTTILNNFLGR